MQDVACAPKTGETLNKLPVATAKKLSTASCWERDNFNKTRVILCTAAWYVSVMNILEKKLAPVYVQPVGLFARMAKLVGIDLCKMQQEKKIDPEFVARMQQHCYACGRPEACGRLLDHTRGRIKDIPDYCTNRRILAELAKTKNK